MVERFGEEILNEDGSLDRAAVANEVFGDEAVSYTHLTLPTSDLV